MVKPVARAFRWRKMLDTGAHATLADLAKAKGAAPSYVSRVLRLTPLAPDLVEANRLYRYYVSQDVLKRGSDACQVCRVPAAEIETAVIDQLHGIFRQPEIIVGTGLAARLER